MDTEKRTTIDKNYETLLENSSVDATDENKSDDTDATCKDESLASLSASSVSTDSRGKDSRLSVTGQTISTSLASNTPLAAPSRSSMNQALQSERDFIEYVMSLPSAPALKESNQLSRIGVLPSMRPKLKTSSIISSTSNATKVGLDHLDNLCKLMEQLSELKETNSKLQRRVQYLEDLKKLHEMHKEIREEVQYGSENVLSQRRHLGLKKSQTSTDYIRGSPRGSEDYAACSSRGSEEFFFKEQKSTKNSRSPSGRRSRALNHPPYDGHRRERSKSVGHEEIYDVKSRRIFPKWSKVKEAFGWESERKNSAKTSKFYFGTNSGVPVSGDPYFVGSRRISTEHELAALRIPLYSDYSEKDEISPIDTYAGEAMAACADGCIAPFNSSAEDIAALLDTYRVNSHTWKRGSGSSEQRLSLLEPPSDGLRRQKSTPSPGSDKIRSYHEMLELKPKSLTIERDMDPEQAFAKFDKDESKKSHKSPWGRVKTIIEKRRDSLKRRHFRRGQMLPQHRYRDSNILEDIDYDLQDAAVTDDSQRKSFDDQYLPNPTLVKLESRCNESSEKMQKRKKQYHPVQSKDFDREKPRQIVSQIPCSQDEKSDNACSRVSNAQDRDVIVRSPGSSPQLHRKSTWMKMKNVLRSKKEGDNPTVLASRSMPSSPNGVHDGTFDFEDTEALEDTNEEIECFENSHEIARVGSDSYVHKLALTTSAPPVSELMLELQRNLSDDFSRKMQEWERMRHSGIRPGPVISPKWERKNSGSKSRKKAEKPKTERLEKPVKAKIKDLTWLEKELQKIEKEKQRLSKEKEKYEERAIRLERLRQTVLTARNSNKKEVLIRTSAGEFRFEGISDAFTKKLYEWETKRGLGPELSTIALLDSSLGTSNKNCLTIQQREKCGNLQRGLSRSESSITEIGQPSHTSSNSLPSLKPPEIVDLERIHHHSRTNSEPDLSSFTGKTNTSTCIQSTFMNQTELTAESSRDTLEGETRDSYVHPEVTQLIDSDVEEVLGVIESRREEQRDENYYSLLEENVILLEQLKNKEEICRRLEKELELLDEKVEEMNKHHQQEMERYREKLWEMHKPDSTPREVQGCLQVITELRSRIENLEKCSEKLKNEKESLEDSFRFHSAEQEYMTRDLLDKMRELHAAGEGNELRYGKNKGGTKENPPASFDIKIVERLQDLSSQLVKQTRELEQALVERTRQICQLRWELLHRDVSTVKLETELHSAHMKCPGPQPRSACDVKRSKYAHFRSWSSEEASSRSRQLQECEARDKGRPKANDIPDAYYKLPKTEFQTNELSNTVHELNREVIRLSTAAESFLGGEANIKGEEKRSPLAENETTANPARSEMTMASQSRSPTISLLTHEKSVSKVMCQLNEVRNSKISVRRNSVGSLSTISGVEPGGSESSSVNDESNRHVSTTKYSPKDSWTDSESSTEEESFTSVSLLSRPEYSNAVPWEASKEMVLKYTSAKRKAYNVDDSDESQEIDNKNEQINPTARKKINYKVLKTVRKLHNRNNQVINQFDRIKQQQSSSAQSESDTAVNNLMLMNNKECQNTKSNNGGTVNIALRKSNYNSLRSCQSADQVTTKIMPHQLDLTTKKNILKKDSFNHMYKSHAVRATSSDSKIPKCNHVNIKKSESCHEGKNRKDIAYKDDLQLTKKLNSGSTGKHGSFRRKNNIESKGINKMQNVTKKSIEQMPEHGRNNRPETVFTESSYAGENKTHDTEDKCSEKVQLQHHSEADMEVMSQLFNQRKKFLPGNNCSSNQNKTEEKYSDEESMGYHNNGSKSLFQTVNKAQILQTSHTQISACTIRKTPDSNATSLEFCNESYIKGQRIDSEKNNLNVNQENNTETKNMTLFSLRSPKEDNCLTNSVILPNSNFENNTFLPKLTIDTSDTSKQIDYATYGQEKSQISNLDQIHLKHEGNIQIPSTTGNENASNTDIIPIASNYYTDSICKNSELKASAKLSMNSSPQVNPNLIQAAVFSLTKCKSLRNEKDMKEKLFTDETNLHESSIENKFNNCSMFTRSKREFKPQESVQTNSEAQQIHGPNYLKSPSAPQLDWKKTCAKKISRQGAPNVKTLIEKYNQKVLENQSPKSPQSSNYNSPAITRKISAPQQNAELQGHIPFSSTPCTPRIMASFHNPLTFKPTNLDLFQSSTESPPTSPSSKLRAEALIKAKEKFISSSSIVTFTHEKSQHTETDIKQNKESFCMHTAQDNLDIGNRQTKRSATDTEIARQQIIQKIKENHDSDNQNNRKSVSSNRSSDSMSLVLFKTGETCQETRLSKRCEKQKIAEDQLKAQELHPKTSKSLPNSSVFKNVTGHEIKLPSSFLRLRRSKKKKDMTTVSQLCRQSLLLGGECSSFATDAAVKSPRSCPSSPELKSKSKSKTSWFQRNLFRLK